MTAFMLGDHEFRQRGDAALRRMPHPQGLIPRLFGHAVQEAPQFFIDLSAPALPAPMSALILPGSLTR